MKAIKIFMCVLLAAGCAGQDFYETDGEITFCPKVNIRGEDKTIVQKAGGKDLFKIEVVGYKGRCYYDERLGKDKAIVAPTFKITRLSQTNVEDVHFSYYMETVKGPTKYLGRKTYFAEANLIKHADEAYYTAKENELTIPAGKYDFDLYVGLNAVKADSEFKVK